MVDLGFIAPSQTTISFSLQPAHNALTSLCLLSEDVAGCDDWVERTAAALTPEQLKTNSRACSFGGTQLDRLDWPSFPAWLDDLAARDPYAMRNAELDIILMKAALHLPGDMPTRAQLLADRALYLSFMQRLLDSMGETCDEIDCEAEYELLQDPPARQRLMLDHFWMMWDAHLAAEWERRLPSLRDSVAAFESLDLRGMSVTDAVRRIIRRDEPPEWSHWRDGIERLVFVPSPHIGPYLLSFHEDTPFALSFHEDTPTALVVFGARIPEGAIVRSSALSRSDLLMRLGALADDTRLRILELVALEGEQGAKEIMDYFGLSKSAASRHLRQLTAHGYLIVRQQEVSKYYRPNPDRIDETCRALKAFLKSDRT